MEKLPLSTRLLPNLPEAMRARLGDLAKLEEVLQQALQRARQSYPQVVVRSEDFLAHMVSLLPAELEPSAALGSLHAAELYLISAFLAGDPRAAELLGAQCLTVATSCLRRLGVAPAAAADLGQRLCSWLLLAEPGQRPRIARYGGRGELQGWLSIVAVRQARAWLQRPLPRLQLDEDAVARLASPQEGQELAYLKRHYREQFRAAFAQALGALTSRERSLLRHQVLSGLNIQEIGNLYGVHRATVARWLAHIRRRLLTSTRLLLMKRLRVGAAELDSIMRLIASNLDLSLQQLLPAD